MQATDVLRRYALTMLEVQIFERMLALLAMTLDRKGSERAVKDTACLKRALDRIELRMSHVFQRASASELRNMLPADRELLQQFALPMIFGEWWQPPS